ncbi:MAG: anti-sigma factor [Bryobacteraceae bacterium]
MKCAGFSAEQYAMFAIGCLDAEEALDVSSHLASDCETCLSETRRSAQFWSLFGASLTAETQFVLPQSGVLPFRRPTARPAQLSWYRWSAIAAALALATASVVYLYDKGLERRSLQPVVVQNNTEIHSLQNRVADLTRERDQLATRASTAAPPASPAPRAVNGTPEEANLRRLLAQRQTELAQLRQTLSSTDAELQRNRESLTALQAQLVSQQHLVDVAAQQQSAAKAQTAAASAAQHSAEEQVRTLSAQVRQLTQQRAQLLEAAQSRQRQISQNRQLTSLLSTPGIRIISVAGSEDAPQSHGYALLTPDHHLEFFASNLPALPNGREYQLWLLRSRGAPVVSGGVFRASSNGTGSVIVSNPSLASNLTSIAVTDEPIGGSRLPTGHKLMIGVARS